MNSVNFFEVLKRSLSGPLVSEKEFNLMVSKKLKEVVKEYDIKFDGENLVPSDDSLADDVYKAALDFYSEVGTYCMDTERVIKFSEEEIKEGLKNAPHKAFFGEGKEAKTFIPRKPESKEPPWCHVGAGIAVSNEEIHSKLVEGYASIPEADSISVPALAFIESVPIRESPIEFYGALKMLASAKEALKRAGKPGMPILNLVSTAASQIAGIAVSAAQFGLKPSNGWLVPTYPELKIGNNELCKAAYLLSWGANIGAEYSPLIGGYSGGPEGTAVVFVANCIQGILVLKSTYQLAWITNVIDRCSSTKDAIWALAVSGQAISRNISFPLIQLHYQAAGPTTKMLFYEVAAGMIEIVASGQAIETAHPDRAVEIDYVTPLEMKFSVEVAYAATGMKRATANEIVKELLKKYENNIKNAPKGKKYQECFDLKTGKPNEEYLKIYSEVKKELKDIGVPIE